MKRIPKSVSQILIFFSRNGFQNPFHTFLKWNLKFVSYFFETDSEIHFTNFFFVKRISESVSYISETNSEIRFTNFILFFCETNFGIRFIHF